jgi:hypothetical protein
MTRTTPELGIAGGPNPIIDELAFPVREFSDALQIDYDTFLHGIIDTHSIDPANASRLIAIDGIANRLGRTRYQELADLNDLCDGFPTPGVIIAPVLRVSGDFSVTDKVMVQVQDKAPWKQYEIFDTRKNLETREVDGISVAFDPKTPRAFTVDDYLTIQGRTTAAHGSLRYRRAAILHSHFNERTNDNTPRHVLRIFGLQLNNTYPGKGSN